MAYGERNDPETTWVRAVPRHNASHRTDYNSLKHTQDSQVTVCPSLATVKFSKDNRIGGFPIFLRGQDFPCSLTYRSKLKRFSRCLDCLNAFTILLFQNWGQACFNQHRFLTPKPWNVIISPYSLKKINKPPGICLFYFSYWNEFLRLK